MKNRRGARFAKALTESSLKDMGQLAQRLVYRLSRDSALRQVAAEVGARVATVDAIAEKAYDEIGGTELSGVFLGSEFAEQPKENIEILAGLYQTHPWVKICTGYIAGQLASIPLRVWRATGFEDGREVLERADDSPVGRMLRWINPLQSPTEFIEDLTSWLVLTGEAYVAYTTPEPGSPSGVPAECYVLFSPFVTKVTSPRRGIVGYQYNVSGEIAYFDAADVVYFKTWSPAGRFRGQGTVSAGYKTLQTDAELRAFNQNVLSQGIHLSGVLETENEDLSADKAEAIRANFEARYSGSKKAAKLAVLWGGLKFSPQTILQKDVMMQEQITNTTNEIIALHGLKPELLTEKFANKATAETVRRMALEDTILGHWGQRIASVFNATGLLRFDPNIRVQWDTRDVPALQTSMTERLTAGETAIRSGQMTINEARDSFLSLPPIDGMEGDLTFVNGVPVSNLLSEGTENPEGTNTQKLLAEVKLQDGVVAKATKNEIAFDRLRATGENRMERALRKVYREMQKEIRTITSRSTVDSQILVEIETVFLFDGRKAVVKAVSDSATASINEAVALEMGHLKLEGLFDIKPVRSLARLNGQEQRIRKMQGNSWVKLRGEISESLQMGESLAKRNQRVSGFFGGEVNNAATIARTETAPAINGATSEVAIEARKKGVDVVSIWETFQDELVRGAKPNDKHNHRQVHGLTIIPGEEMFKVSGDNMEFPGDSWNGAAAGNTINCRCGIRNEIRKIQDSDNRGE